MTTLDTLLALDRELAAGDGDTYRRLLRDDAVVIVPGQVLDAAGTAAAMDASPGWDELALEDARLVALGDGAALLTYRFRGRRGEHFTYSAQMTSGWTRAAGDWRMTFHQQTPLA
jgi:hypothetical protein